MENVFEKTFKNVIISIEQDIKRSHFKGSVGFQILTREDTLWVCIDGQAVIRCKPDPFETAVLSCPFCGNKPNGPENNGEEWFIECERCLFGLEDISRTELIDRWNTRNGKKI
jgi:hypothetical protein